MILRIINICFVLFALIFFSDCKNSIKNSKRDKLQIVKLADSLFREKKHLEVYIKQTNERKLIKIEDFNNWPGNIEMVYNLLFYNDRPLMYKEIPHIESGDFKNIYSYYFNDSLKVIAVKYHSIFFDSRCVEGALNKEIIRYYDSNYQIEEERISYYDSNKNTVIDTANCINNYEIDLDLKYKSFYETPLSPKVE